MARPDRWVRCSLRPSLLLVAGLLVGGCTQWRAETTPLPARLAESPPTQIRVWLRDGWHTELLSPVILRDTLHGYQHGTEAFSVPMSEVSRYETQHAAVNKWILVPVLVVAIPLALLAILVPNGFNPGG